MIFGGVGVSWVSHEGRPYDAFHVIAIMVVSKP